MPGENGKCIGERPNQPGRFSLVGMSVQLRHCIWYAAEPARPHKPAAVTERSSLRSARAAFCFWPQSPNSPAEIFPAPYPKISNAKIQASMPGKSPLQIALPENGHRQSYSIGLATNPSASAQLPPRAIAKAIQPINFRMHADIATVVPIKNARLRPIRSRHEGTHSGQKNQSPTQRLCITFDARFKHAPRAKPASLIPTTCASVHRPNTIPIVTPPAASREEFPALTPKPAFHV